MRAIAMGLQLKKDHFDDMFSNPSAWMAMWSYPAHPSKDSSWGVGPHTDHEVLTMVLQDDVGGLEVQFSEGEWIDVPPIPGNFILIEVLSLPTRLGNLSDRRYLKRLTAPPVGGIIVCFRYPTYPLIKCPCRNRFIFLLWVEKAL